jgi:aryl-alcohol dehydrogenase-like predicted oxidoreductase
LKRRHFVKATLAAGVASQFGRLNAGELAMIAASAIPTRPYVNGVRLSVIGMGGIVVMGGSQKDADDRVAEAVSAGINYFDVAPSYGDGEAEEKLGPALRPYRKNSFLACKTMERSAAGAGKELRRSLKRLKTDYLDLYQFHAVTSMEDVERIFAPGGAAEVFIKAHRDGLVRHLGFSAHSESAALAMMDRLRFDSILFPFNVVCFSRGDFGPRVLQKAKEKGIARLALKAMAYTPWPKDAQRTHPKCWYRPIDEEDLARQALRFTLSEDVTAALPPGDEKLFAMAVRLAPSLSPLTPDERERLLARTRHLEPLFKA